MNIHDKEITEVKGEIKALENRVKNLERTSDRHDQQIISMNEKVIKIDDNTTWIKRTITAAIVTAISTDIMGGAIANFFNV